MGNKLWSGSATLGMAGRYRTFSRTGFLSVHSTERQACRAPPGQKATVSRLDNISSISLLIGFFKNNNVMCLFLALLGPHCCRAFALVVESGELLCSWGAQTSLQWCLLLQSTGSRACGLP